MVLVVGAATTGEILARLAGGGTTSGVLASAASVTSAMICGERTVLADDGIVPLHQIDGFVRSEI